METYQVTQALMSVGSVYHVSKPHEDAKLFTIRGELMSATPKFHLVEGDDGATRADLSGNFIKTRYEVHKDGKLLATLVFPAVAFKKKLTLTAGDATYEADGGVFKGVFQCKSADGKVLLEIAKDLGVRDSFVVKADASFPMEIGLLAAVAIHSRFYEMV